MALLLAPFTPIFDLSGRFRSDARIAVFEAGTTTPAAVYLDDDFSNPAENPMLSDAGVVPAIYVGNGDYLVRAEDANGTTIRSYDNVTISGGAEVVEPGDPSDVTAVFSTGDLKDRYSVGALTGWVRGNGRTIGAAGSGATERANADTEALFLFLWAADGNLAVSGGRGASAAADFAAAKTIALPDFRGRFRGTLDDNGGTAAGRLAGITFAYGTATTLGAYGGAITVTIATGNLPAHNHSLVGGTVSAPVPQLHNHAYTTRSATANAASGGGVTQLWTGTVGTVTSDEGDHTHTLSGNTANAGSGTALPIPPPFILVSTYLKL
jgi:microcystin-dependent protein